MQRSSDNKGAGLPSHSLHFLFKAHHTKGGQSLGEMLSRARLRIRTLATPTPSLSVQPTPVSTRRLNRVALPGYFQTSSTPPARLPHPLLHRSLQLPGPLGRSLGVRGLSVLARGRNLLAFTTHGVQGRGDVGCLVTGGQGAVCSSPHLLQARCYSSPQESRGDPEGQWELGIEGVG